ncbi:MAG: hypothetical protein GF418_06790 [Chitinivibrionales bacterium]|nr:hypothetical protein [Chitinivibrionales bacterium]MBD3395316.1 hypothetical protein [Chitinivibrionales bacterium]
MRMMQMAVLLSACMAVYGQAGVLVPRKAGGGASREKPHDLIYTEFSVGYGTFSMGNMNEYYIDRHSSIFNNAITGGPVLIAELGTFIGPRVKLGISYVQAKGVTESSVSDTFTYVEGRDTNTVAWSSWFLDTYFRGIGLSGRYYPYRGNKVRVFIGGRNIWGRGFTHLGFGERPESRFENYGYVNFGGTGIGVSAFSGIELFPVNHISLGLVAGYRILRTEVMQSATDGWPWRRPDDDPHNINLDFSGFAVRGKVSVEM